MPTRAINRIQKYPHSMLFTSQQSRNGDIDGNGNGQSNGGNDGGNSQGCCGFINAKLGKLHSDDRTLDPICSKMALHVTESSKKIANYPLSCFFYQILHMALFLFAFAMIASASTEMFVTFLDMVEKSKSFKPCPKGYEFVKGHNEDGFRNCKMCSPDTFYPTLLHACVECIGAFELTTDSRGVRHCKCPPNTRLYFRSVDDFKCIPIADHSSSHIILYTACGSGFMIIVAFITYRVSYLYYYRQMQ